MISTLPTTGVVVKKEIEMSDAYGTLYFSKSEDCQFDRDELIKKLNTYKWAECGTFWTPIEGSNFVKPSKEYSQYPTVYPGKIISICVETEEGDRKFTSEDEIMKINVNDIDVLDIDFKYPSLDEICADISEHIFSGNITISLSANGKGYEYSQFLKIFSNGQGIRHYTTTGAGSSEVRPTEYTSCFVSL